MTQATKNVNLECELRFAHIDGHTELDYIPGENKIVTVGVDCEVRVWSLDDGDIKENFTVDDSIYSVVANKERFFVAMDNNCVKSFQLTDGEDESTICRFTANATHLSMHPDREFIVAAAADFSIKLINLDDRSEKLFEGHTAPVLSVALDPLNKYIASSSCDGTACVWSIDSRKVFHQWKNVFPRSNDFENSSTLCRMEWQPSLGDVLALPKPDGLELFKRGQWEKTWKKITNSELSDISIAAFSHNGQLVAAASTQSIVMVWKMSDILSDNQQPLSILYMASTCVTSLKFSTINPYQFCCCDKTGGLRILKILSAGTTKPSVASVSSSFKEPVSVDTTKKKTGLSQEDLENIFDEMDDDDDDFSFVTEQKKEIHSHKTTKKLTGDEETTVEIDKIISLSVKEKSKIDPASLCDDINNDLNDNFDAEFDIGAIKSRYEPMIFGEDIDDVKKVSQLGTTITSSNFVSRSSSSEIVIDGQKINGKELLSLLRQPRVSIPSRQVSFQSGSTPTHYKKRFMVWNSVGIVYSYNTDEERSIDVEFHDVSFHHSIHMTNMFNYSMADLSNVCLLLGSNGDDEADDELEHTKARIFCQLFNTWDSIKEWQVDLPKDEQIDAIAAGQTFIAIATSQLYLRIWTVGGIQTSILSLNGPAVNLSAYDRFLMILYHQAMHYSEQGQSIACQVLKIDHKGKTRCHPIPTPVAVALSPKASVYWAGFTDEGTPCTVDSDGIIRLYKSHFGNGWFPICATKEHANGKSDNFFIIGLSEIQAQVRCIFCKASRYPDTVPKPTLTILSFQIPLCEMYTNKSKHEEECIRSRWLSSLLKKLSTDGYDVDTSLENADKKIINSLIKLFALSLGAERESLALEIAGIMPNRNALEGAVRYAERQKHRSLAMKLIEMIQDEDDGNVSEEDDKNSDTELQELMVKKNVDHMRQLVTDVNEESSSSRLVSLSKYGADSSDFTVLKPKLMKNGSNSASFEPQGTNDDDDEDEVELMEENDTDSVDNVLRPKKMDTANRNNTKNPFKVNNQNKMKSTNERIRESNRKRKQYDEDEVEIIDDDENTRTSFGGHESDGESDAFVHYFDSVKEQLLEDNDDEVESEGDLLRLAKTHFESLSESEKKKWKKLANKKPSKSKAKAAKRTKQNGENEKREEEPKVNKITNFFKRN